MIFEKVLKKEEVLSYLEYGEYGYINILHSYTSGRFFDESLNDLYEYLKNDEKPFEKIDEKIEHFKNMLKW